MSDTNSYEAIKTNIKTPKKCRNCKKKLTMVDKTINNCSSCDKKFCIRCLQPEKHNCDCSIERQTKSFEKVIADKMEKI